MERFGTQSFESSEDKKDKKDKKKGDSTTKAVKSLSSVLRVQSEKAEHSTSVRPVEKKLAHIAGEYTELFGAKSTKPKPKVERPKTTEEPSTPKEVMTAEDKPVFKTIEAEERTRAEAFLEHAATNTERLDKAAEKDEDTDETYEELPDYKVKKGDLFEGELYIRDKKPVSERVILLQGEEPAVIETEPEPAVLELQSQQHEEHQAGDQAPEAVPESEPELELELNLGPEPDVEPALPGTGGGEVPPTEPPERPGFEFAQPEEPERPARLYSAEADSRPEPAQVYREYMQRQAASHQAATERGVTKKELDDAVYYATKAGQNRGVLTGLLVGGAYEHFKHKRREKKAEKRTKAKIKQLEAARRDYRFNLQNQERRQVVTEARLSAAEHRFTVAEKRLAEQVVPSPEITPIPAGQQQPEQRPTVQLEQLVLPPEHRLEKSSWLSTEIDKKTGKVVERPTFQYGHEYYRERAQEGLPAHQRHTATGGVALAGTVGGSQGPTDNTSPSASYIPSATMQGNPSQLHAQQDANPMRPENAEQPSRSTPLWPWIVALVVIAICLLVALH